MTNNFNQRNKFAEDNKLNNVAIIIGINDYKNEKKFKKLNNAVSDAVELAQVLDKSYDYNVHLFVDSLQGKPWTGNPIQSPTFDAIDTFLTKKLPAIVKKNSENLQKPLKTCLLFYFAGHGETEGSDKELKGFLIPQDAGDSSDSWLYMGTLYKALQSSGCHHVLIILDCCHAGAFIWGKQERASKVVQGEFYREHLQRYVNEKAQQLLYSATYNQKASDGHQESDKPGNSPFATALLDVLRRNIQGSLEGSASKGIITTTHLLYHIENRLSDLSQQPDIRPLDEKLVGKYIFYNPKFDGKLDNAPDIDPTNNPYRGLQAFEERHAHKFCGRDKLRDELLKRINSRVVKRHEDLTSQETKPPAPGVATKENLSQQPQTVLPLTIVLGNSGSGKSSLVKAGLLPKLRSEQAEQQTEANRSLPESTEEVTKTEWRILDPIRPSPDPFMALARAFLPVENDTLLDHPTLKQLDQFFDKLLSALKKVQANQVQATAKQTKETKKAGEGKKAERAKEQFAEFWKDMTPEAKLLFIRDYFNEKDIFNVDDLKEISNVDDLKKTDLLKEIKEYCGEGIKDLYEQIKGTLDQSVLRPKKNENNPDEVEDNCEALAQLVQGWLAKQQENKPEKFQDNLRILLVVDQLEELITLDRSDQKKTKSKGKKPQASNRDQFLNMILVALKAHSERFRVVMTLRLDFEPRFIDSPLKDWWQHSRFPVRPMSSDELRQAIEEPAHAHALEFEPPELVGNLIDELGQPGALPLLSFVLSELYLELADTWKGGNDKRALKLDKTKHTGGIPGFLSQRADEEYEKLTKSKADGGFDAEEGKHYQTMMQQVMLRMVTIEGGGAAKRRVYESELKYPKLGKTNLQNNHRKEVLKRLVDARLLVKGRDEGESYYELAHDYLISGWKNLQDWIKQREDELALQTQLTPSAQYWKEREKERLQKVALQNFPTPGAATLTIPARREDVHEIGKLIGHKARQLATLTGYAAFFWLPDKVEWINRKRARWWKNQQKDQNSNSQTGKPARYLWHNDPRVEQLNLLLDARSWLNELEADFVRCSVVKKRRGWTGFYIVCGVVVSIIGIAGLAAIIGERKAQLEQARARTEANNSELLNGRELEALQSAIEGNSAIQQNWLSWLLSVPSVSKRLQVPDSVPVENNLREALYKSVYLTKERNRLSMNRGNIYRIATAPDSVSQVKGKARDIRIATVEEGDNVRLLNASGTQVFQLSACPLEQNKESCKSVNSAALAVVPTMDSKKQLQLATGGDNGVVYLWNIKPDGRIDSPIKLPSVPEASNKLVDELTYNSQGTKLAAIQNGKLWLWQRENEDKWQAPKQISLPNETEPISIAFNPKKDQQKDQLVVGLDNGQIIQNALNVSNPKEEQPINSDEVGTDTYNLAFSQDGNKLAVGGERGTAKLFSVNGDGTINLNSPQERFLQSITYDLAFLDNRELLTVGVSDTVARYVLHNLQLIDRNPVTAQENQKRQVKSTVYSPDGQLIATVANDDSIRLWDRQGRQLARSDERPYYVQSLAFSPDSKMLVSSGSRGPSLGGTGVIEAWNISSQQPDLNEPVGAYNDSSLSASTHVEFVVSTSGQASNPQEIYSLGVDGTVTRLRISKEGKFSKSNVTSGYDYLSKSLGFAYSPTGKQVAVVTQDKAGIRRVEVWQLTPSPKQIASDTAYRYTSVAFSPDGTRLATGSENGWVQLWNIPLNQNGDLPLNQNGTVQPGKAPSPFKWFQTHQKAVNTLAFNPEAFNTLMTGGDNGEVKLWDLSQTTPDFSRLTLKAAETVAFSPSTPILTPQPVLSSLQLGWLSSWFRPKRVQRLAIIDGDGQTGNNQVAQNKENKQFKLWNLRPDGSAKLSETKLSQKDKAELAQSKQLVLSPDGSLLVAINAGNTAKAWNLNSGEAIDWNERATAAEFSQNGQILITLESNQQNGEQDRKLKFWHINKNLIQPLEIESSESQPQASLSPETPSPETTAQNAATNSVPKVDHLDQVTFSPDGQELAILSGDKIELQKISITNGTLKLEKQPFWTLPQADDQILFSPDGKLIATIGKDGNREAMRLWEYTSRTLKATLTLPGINTTPSANQVKVAFSPESDLIITTNSQGTFSIWDTDGNSISYFSETIKNASFTADGKHLVVVRPNGEVVFWSIDRQELLAKACELMREYGHNNSVAIKLETCPKAASETSGPEVALSTGDKLLISSVTNLYKLSGIQWFSQSNFKTAAEYLKQSLNIQPNDPEARIYYNNAKILEHSANTEANIYTIAVAVPISSNPNGAAEVLRGVAQAQKAVNESGGINGKFLQVLIADDWGQPEAAKRVAEEIARNPDVLGVIGHFSSDTTRAAGEIYEQEKLVAISPVSTAVESTGWFDFNPYIFGNPYLFRTVPNDRHTAEALVKHLRERLKQEKAVVFFNSKSEYSKSLSSEFEKALANDRGQVVQKIDVSEPNFNATQTVEKIDSRAQALMLLTDTSKLDVTLEIVKANNSPNKRPSLLAGDDIYTLKTLQEGKENAVGMTIAVSWHIDSNLDFAKKAKQLWDGSVNWRTAMAYDATQAFIEALRQTAREKCVTHDSTTKETRECIAQKLRSKDFFVNNGASGRIQFEQSGDRKGNNSRDSGLVRVGYKGAQSRSRTGYDFEPVQNP